MLSKNKFVVVLLVMVGLFGGILLLNVSTSVETLAQKVIRGSMRFENQWEYCVITHISADNPPPENLVELVGSVQINYFRAYYDRIALKEKYVQDECITHKLNYAEFLHERDLKNTAQSRALANERAADLALAKALTKLGKDGWEMTGRSLANFNFETTSGNSEYKHSLYFRRLVGQQQVTVPQQ